MAIRPWFSAATLSEREAADEALMHWLCHCEWPEMTETVQGLVHLRLAFCLHVLLQVMTEGREAPQGAAQRRGSLRGILFRQWELHQEWWLDDYARNWPDLRSMDGAGQN